MLLEHVTPAMQPSAFLALDPKLPLLAARAAVEIDNLLIDTARNPASGSLEAVEKILSLIQNAPPASANGGDSAKSFSDPLSNALFARAYDSSLKKLAVDSDNSLRTAMETLSKQLSEHATSNTDFLRAFRDFFLALSIAVSNTRAVTANDRFKHAHKR